jgi:hypothetical protein
VYLEESTQLFRFDKGTYPLPDRAWVIVEGFRLRAVQWLGDLAPATKPRRFAF